jgi:hypothetical protein
VKVEDDAPENLVLVEETDGPQENYSCAYDSVMTILLRVPNLLGIRSYAQRFFMEDDD